MNNLPVNVAVFSLCRKETLFQMEFQEVEIVVLFCHRETLTRHMLLLFFFGGGGVSGLGVFVLEPRNYQLTFISLQKPQFIKILIYIGYITERKCDSYEIFGYVTRYTLTFTAGLKCN